MGNQEAVEKTLNNVQEKYLKGIILTKAKALSLYNGYNQHTKRKAQLTKKRHLEIIDVLHRPKEAQKTLHQINTLIVYNLKSEPLRRLFIDVFIKGVRQVDHAKKEVELESTISKRMTKLIGKIRKMNEIKILLQDVEIWPFYSIGEKATIQQAWNKKPSKGFAYPKKFNRTYIARQTKLERKKLKTKTFTSDVIKNYTGQDEPNAKHYPVNHQEHIAGLLASYKSIMKPAILDYGKTYKLHTPKKYHLHGTLKYRNKILCKFDTSKVIIQIPTTKKKEYKGYLINKINNFLSSANLNIRLSGNKTAATFADVKDNMIKFHSRFEILRSTI